MLDFTPYWDYKPTNAIHADQLGVYTSHRILNLGTINRIFLKCNVVDGSVQDGLRQSILFNFVLDKPSGYKIFHNPETIHYKI